MQQAFWKVVRCFQYLFRLNLAYKDLILTLQCVHACSVVSNSLWPMDCSSPGSSVHGDSPARILEWAATSYSRGSSRPRDRNHISCVSYIAGGFFTTEPLEKPLSLLHYDKLSKELNSLLTTDNYLSLWNCYCFRGFWSSFPTWLYLCLKQQIMIQQQRF